MPKFFVSTEDIQGKYITLHHDIHHIVNVLRKGVGDTFTVCDGKNTDYDCEIIEISRNEDQMILKIRAKHSSDTEPEVFVTLFQALPKADKMELILQKGTEIGVSCFVPFVSERCIVKLDERKAKDKVERWNKITEAAAKQSGRGNIPTVKNVLSMKEALTELKTQDLAVFFYEHAEGRSLKDLLKAQAAEGIPKKLALIIGPEGGFSDAEVSAFEAAGCRTASLGPRILRTETAGMVGAALILYEYGQM